MLVVVLTTFNCFVFVGYVGVGFFCGVDAYGDIEVVRVDCGGHRRVCCCHFLLSFLAMTVSYS